MTTWCIDKGNNEEYRASLVSMKGRVKAKHNAYNDAALENDIYSSGTKEKSKGSTIYELRYGKSWEKKKFPSKGRARLGPLSNW